MAASDDLHIAPYREDGVTYRTPNWIWSVVVDDAYCAKYKGSPYLAPMIAAGPRSATIRILPR
ncbi:MAG: DUF2255 family protein [Acidobacteriaceae bacterium]